MGQQAWHKSFDLQSAVDLGCAVGTSGGEEEIVTVAGFQEVSRRMFKYNVRTGEAVEYSNPFPGEVERSFFGCRLQSWVCVLLFIGLRPKDDFRAKMALRITDFWAKPNEIKKTQHDYTKRLIEFSIDEMIEKLQVASFVIKKHFNFHFVHSIPTVATGQCKTN